MKLSSRELGTVLAALRMWQLVQSTENRTNNEIATDGGTQHPLTDLEIDDLCQRINHASQ